MSNWTIDHVRAHQAARCEARGSAIPTRGQVLLGLGYVGAGIVATAGYVIHFDPTVMPAAPFLMSMLVLMGLRGGVLKPTRSIRSTARYRPRRHTQPAHRQLIAAPPKGTKDPRTHAHRPYRKPGVPAEAGVTQEFTGARK